MTAAALLAAACGSPGTGTPSGSSATAGPAQPVATSITSLPPQTDQGGNGQPVDGVQCLSTEQLAYHIHAHLTLLVDGVNAYIPAGVGITPPREFDQGFVVGGTCFYWLHTHDLSGIIHIESPSSQLYTLGQFFAIWGEPLTATQVASFPISDAEPLHAFVNGVPYEGDPGQIQLVAHAQITLEIGRQVLPPAFTFPPGS